MVAHPRRNPTLPKTTTLGARLKRTLAGGFARKYRDQSGNALNTRLEQAVSRLLEFTRTQYKYKPVIRLANGSTVVPSFATREGVIFVSSETMARQTRQMLLKTRRYRPDLRVLLVSTPGLSHDFEGLGIAAVTLNPDEQDFAVASRAIFLDDPSFAFDYSHILPTAAKCSVLHGHTSAVLIELVGQPKDGIIIDFGEAKRIIRAALEQMDHKLFIAKRYVVEADELTYRIQFKGPKGEFDLKVPRTTTFVMEGQATTENLAEEVLNLILPQMPPNIEVVGAYVYEGLNKGSHLLASTLSRRRRAS